MTRRRRKRTAKPRPKLNWQTRVWYVIGALIVLAMVFSLFASALSSSHVF